jgi:HD-like signal output (HDOD) protein
MTTSPNTDGDVLDRDALRECVLSTLTRLSRTGELPALSATATAALGVARDPDGHVEDLCRVIRTDVGISARILRAANSAVFARRTSAKTVPEAVLTIGLRKTCDLLVAASARRLFDGANRNAELLWNHALAVALAAEELARVKRQGDPASVFLPGLFHDVGRIAFLIADPIAYDVIHTLAAEGEGTTSELERAWYGFDHAEAGAILVEDWGLAVDQCDAIRWHHEPQRAEAGKGIAAILHAADALAYTMGFGVSTPPPHDDGVGALDLSPEDQPACMARIHDAFVRQNELLR